VHALQTGRRFLKLIESVILLRRFYESNFNLRPLLAFHIQIAGGSVYANRAAGRKTHALGFGYLNPLLGCR
jgi:hypothetical protein